MTSEAMNHEEAITRLAAERYLLGEMQEEERTAFEEHYLNCAKCLEDVAFGDDFMQAAQEASRELAAEASSRAPERESGTFFSRLLAGLRSPAPAWAMALVLGAVATYQGLNREKGARPETRSVLAGMSHGAGDVKLVQTSRENILSLGVPYTRSGEFVSYRAEVVSYSGETKYAVAIPGNETGNMAWIALLAKTLNTGRYSVVIMGKTGDGAEKEVGQGSFELQFEKQ